MRAYERLLHYVSFGTQSDHTSETVPSTASQKVLAADLVEEMKKIGIDDAFVDDKGYVYGSIPATKGKEDKPVIGFIAHMDTAEDASGDNIRAKVVEYNGGDILLNEEKQIYLTEKEYPSIKKYVGQHLMVTDGTTLLGADDKAGVAEIMTMAEQLLNDPTIEHGKSASVLPRTRRLVAAPTTLTSKASAHSLPTPSTAASWASWNMKTSTPLLPT